MTAHQINDADGQDSAQYTITAVRLGPRCSRVAASGELDLAAADRLSTVLDQQCQSGNWFAQLDLSAVTFLDCSCLRVLLAAHHRFLASKGSVVLTGVGPRIERLLTLTGLDTVFTIAIPTSPRP